VLEANLFKKESSISTGDNIEQTARVSTRIYIILLTASMIVIGLFNGFREVTVSHTVAAPSSALFQELHALYPNTLSCPCQRISVPYSTILSVEPIYHQVSHGRIQSNDMNLLLIFCRVHPLMNVS
jgi:hypothetical protein